MGKLYSKTGNDSIAVIQYKKALDMDTSRKDLLGDMAYSAFKMKKFKDAANMYQKKIDCSEKPSANDYFGLGRVYYFMKDFARADSAFEMVVRLSPEYPLGYLWRAKANVQLDPKNEKWLAKAHYENFLSRIKPEETERNKKDISEANWYIGNYHVAKKDYTSAKPFFAKMQELDPANKVAKEFFNSEEVKKLK
jgi:tetratricopeptide (TPR) repeat protein